MSRFVVRAVFIALGVALILIAGIVGVGVLRPNSPRLPIATLLPVPTSVPAPMRGAGPVPTGAGALPQRPPTLSLPQAQATQAVLALQATVAAQTRLYPPTERPRPIPPPAVFLGQDSRTISAPPGWRGPPPFTVPIAAFIMRDSRDPAGCRAWQFDWGDGSTAQLPCTQLPATDYGPQPGIVTRHVYTTTGAFTITATVVLTDGRQLTARAQPVTVSPYLSAPADPGPRKWLIWGGSVLALLGGIVALGRYRPRRRRLGRAALLLILVTYITPFSFLPNPLGLLWSLNGGYTYDTRLPFVNRFVMLDDPTRALAGELEGLIGRTGLDPLDPHAPLLNYQFETVTLVDRTQTQVHTEMTYADGTQRWYDLPLYGFRPIYREYWISSWNNDGLGRVTAAQQDLPLIPRAGADSPIQLGDPQRVPLPVAAERLDTANTDNWLLRFEQNPVQQRLMPAPGGEAFLLTTPGRVARNLWLVPLDGRAPFALAEGVTAYGWTPDGSWIVYTLANPSHSIVAVRPDGRTRHEVAQSRSAALPGLSNGGIWYTAGSSLYIAPLSGGPPTEQFLAGPLPLGVVRPSPDERRIVYRCADHWCGQPLAGGPLTTFARVGTEAAWSPDGRYVALADPQPIIYDSAGGQALRHIPIEQTLTGTQLSWTSDSRYLLAAVFPDRGRRIIVADTVTHGLWDLSRPQWDVGFALLPKRSALLLTNGRGGFWRVPLRFTSAAQP